MENGPPRILSNFSVPEPRWLIGRWGPCDKIVDAISVDCGQGFRRREVVCTLGHAAACVPRNGAQPPREEPCEDFGDCQWSFACPFGWGNGLDCAAQQLIALVSISALSCCLFSCCVWRTYRRCKPPTSGMAKLSSMKVYAHYEVDNMQKSDKQHIVWDTDVIVLEQLELSSKEEHYEELVTAPADEEEDDSWAGAGANRSVGDVQVSFPWNYSAFYCGDVVEYYSSRNRRWLLANVAGLGVEVPLLGLDHSGATLSVGNSAMGELDYSYDVVVGATKQLRPFVALPLLRPPFCQDDAVEVYQDGQWHAADVCGKQSISATTLGYDVKLIDEAASTRVPAVRLRPRFPPGVDVDVYRGIQLGWRPAVTLAGEGDANGCGREPVPIIAGQSAIRQRKVPGPSSPRNADKAHAAGTDPDGPLQEVHYWTWVVVRPSISLGSPSRDVNEELLPSFLLRARSRRTHAPLSARSVPHSPSAGVRPLVALAARHDLAVHQDSQSQQLLLSI